MGLLRTIAWRTGAFGLFAAVLAGVLSAQVSREYDLKAAFLYNFAAFVEWPEQSLPPSPAPFVIGVLGYDPFGPVLDEITAGERAKDRPMRVRRVERLSDVRGCQILFISRSEGWRLPEILRRCEGTGVLTVSDMPGFLKAGGMISLDTEGSRIVLQVNLEAVERSDLVISSKLLRVARLYREPSLP